MFKSYGGEIFVPKLPSYNIMDLANAVSEKCKKKIKFDENIAIYFCIGILVVTFLIFILIIKQTLTFFITTIFIFHKLTAKYR